MTAKTRKALIADAKRLHGQLSFAIAASQRESEERERLTKVQVELGRIIAELYRGAGGP